MKLHAMTLSLAVLLLVPAGKPGNGAYQQKSVQIPMRAAVDVVSIQANVDYGAQLLLVDAQGNRTGYDKGTGKLLHQISGASYVDDSISDESDDSDDAATAESRVLRIPPGAYLLKIVPTDRNSYRIQFSCRESGKASRVAGESIGISPGEEHSYSVNSSGGCSGAFVAGALPSERASPDSLLSYAFPPSGTVHLPKGIPFRIVLVYGNDLMPASFVATLNGEGIGATFHPKPGGIESVSIPAKPGHNVLQLTANGRQADSGSSSTLTFTIDAE